jgi:L-threonylcarbamoyladenylate synthase
VLDAGRCEIGVASTILDLSSDEPRILREGAVLASELEQQIKG